MKRREFITLIGAAAAWPCSPRAQQTKAPLRIGFLPVGSPSNPYAQSLVAAFRQGLHDLGVIENRDVVLDLVWIKDEPEIPHAISALVERGAKLLIPAGTSASVAAKRQVSTIPILFINVGNPTGVGLVESLSHPGGNVTGLSDMHADLAGKYVQFAVDLRPKATVGYLWYTGFEDGKYRLQVSQEAARSLGVDLRPWGIADMSEADGTLDLVKASGAAIVIVASSPFMFRHREQLIDSALKHGIGTIYPWPPAAKDGALIGYGPNYAVLYRRAADYVKRILEGTKPSDLPVEQPTSFEFVINLKTAKALGLDVPPTLLVTPPTR
jgi:putative ABC transport system substrate-binding protein